MTFCMYRRHKKVRNMNEKRKRNKGEFITIRISRVAAHWLKKISGVLGKTQVDTLEDILFPLYTQSKLVPLDKPNSVNMTVLKTEKFDFVVFQFTKQTNIEPQKKVTENV